MKSGRQQWRAASWLVCNSTVRKDPYCELWGRRERADHTWAIFGNHTGDRSCLNTVDDVVASARD
jgi:hypothetical protein